MTIKIGTIQEMTGNGYEILVDSETRSYVLAKFLDGHLVESANSEANASANGHTIAHERTLVAQPM
ncbi:MAG: hypothetical protein ACJ763_16930 [Bdellovibrionia bacterium]